MIVRSLFRSIFREWVAVGVRLAGYQGHITLSTNSKTRHPQKCPSLGSGCQQLVVAL